jgi:aminoglycoside N3'-acetyltransferase
MQGSIATPQPARSSGQIGRDQLVEDLKRLGVQSGFIYNVKASLKSIGTVEGGAATVVEALIEAVQPGGTIVTDSFVDPFPLPLNKRQALIFSDRHTPSYAGAIANAMLKHPSAHCSRHPIQRFVAIGHHAEKLMADHKPESYAYGVLSVMADSGIGRNLKIGPDEKVVGVGTTHVAIGRMGFRQKRKPYGINYIDENGEIKLCKRDWSGGCGVGFNNYIPLYRENGCIVSEGFIGRAPSKITDMAKTLALELEVLEKNPAFFLCHDPACYDCRTGWEFSDGSVFSVYWHKALKKLRRWLKTN